MKRLTNWIAVPMSMLLVSVSLAAWPQYVCGLTGKVSSKCCCVQKAGKLLCKDAGKTLDTCWCTTK